MLKVICLFASLLFLPGISFSKTENDTLIEICCTTVEILRHGNLYGNWHYLINSEKEFRKIIGGRTDIDFSKFTLVGVVTFSGGCTAPDVFHVINYSKSSGNYTYELKIKTHGGCENNIPIEIWCLIPKMAEGAIMVFDKNVQ